MMPMTNHPITPPPELVEQWRTAPEYTTDREKLTMMSMTTRRLQEIADQSAQYGADQELEACCEYMQHEDFHGFAKELRAARRPKPPSLKEQALGALGRFNANAHTHASQMTQDFEIIRRALEQLDD